MHVLKLAVRRRARRFVGSTAALLLSLALIDPPCALAEPLAFTLDDAPPDVADVPSLDLRAGKRERMRYFLIGHDEKAGEESKATQPEDGRKLLVVLPGGDGSADHNPFVRRIWKHALSKEWLIAQLVAPKWSDDQHEKIVWPTKGRPWPKMEFSTEEFIDAVIADAGKRAKIDASHIYLLAWSSSGPAVYEYALGPKPKAAGFFIAMSIFQPARLPKLDAAKGRAFYLLHSPADFIPIAQPKKAEELLEKAGAKVELATYEGGHGWRGDVYGNLRKGIEWLETERTAMKPKTSAPQRTQR